MMCDFNLTKQGFLGQVQKRQFTLIQFLISVETVVLRMASLGLQMHPKYLADLTRLQLL